MRLSTESIVEKTQWIDMLEQVLSDVLGHSFRSAVCLSFNALLSVCTKWHEDQSIRTYSSLRLINTYLFVRTYCIV
jgi:hypothetical protein